MQLHRCTNVGRAGDASRDRLRSGRHLAARQMKERAKSRLEPGRTSSVSQCCLAVKAWKTPLRHLSASALSIQVARPRSFAAAPDDRCRETRATSHTSITSSPVESLGPHTTVCEDATRQKSCRWPKNWASIEVVGALSPSEGLQEIRLSTVTRHPPKRGLRGHGRAREELCRPCSCRSGAAENAGL